ncbi:MULTISPECIES: carbohydrate ABC transporter permease [unclassified Mesorhizobium]|uniref:carbohydrate ABC transporter permease n=1 Tax=unclassified Mesorhizobium TaxID=325217 RepID=UPI000F75C764|nr:MULTISPECIES: carbohydrate ABC transporter permease [unclassified Mesorhizobium]AZO05133.1 carbohydrate ABC transporter permease [Mesorhizobium sp. M2A.F.Ca.ET.043.02.1.1]RWB42900.1 MAG: carbohydrate ABC transporter permease [Mesorhizobium sp.]RWB64903.1 MAG: carbohydrate ABC transporter permease [Mesorhizobium sp.]RWB88137.1 MAG: carbohydrate ABC transporter permease [Mesorhizobium sp.]RWD77327.1 MAG: carbohydrate ABC transporter permease [Mesorhizobium sp.]
MTRRYTVLTAFSFLALLMIAPTVLAISTSLKPAAEADVPWAIPHVWTFEHYVAVWTDGGFGRYFFNSFIISFVDAIVMIVFASLAAYALTFMSFPGKQLIRFAFLAGLMVPVTAIVLPLYASIRSLGLIGTHLGVILCDVALALPIFVFLFASYFRKIPVSLHDAARVDGASEWEIYSKVILPIARPVVVTTGLLEFLWSWNDLLLRLVLMPREQSRTLAVGLLMFQGGQTRDITSLSAGAVIMALPVVLLFIIFQRHFVRGMTAGAVK